MKDWTVVLNQSVCVSESVSMLIIWPWELTLQAVIRSNLVHHFFIVLVLQTVASIWMEQLVCNTVAGIRMQRCLVSQIPQQLYQLILKTNLSVCECQLYSFLT
jgi:hypothetical protein